MNDNQHVSHFELFVNGAQAEPALMDDLLDCTIENSQHLPDVCVLRFHDEQFKWVDDERLTEATLIQVRGGHENGPLTSIFQGEITALEMDMVAGGVPTIVLRCYDLSHRLHRGRQSRTFENVKDSDIVKKVAGQLGFNLHIKQTKVVHDWVLQNNQTNWEFLQERASYAGFRLYVRNQRDLYFEPVKDEGDGVVELQWGKDLRSFRPRRSAATQVDEVEVRGWDFHQKKAIVGVSKQPKGVPHVAHNQPKSIAKKFGPARHVICHKPVHSQSEAEDLAQSTHDKIASEYLQAEGLCYGRPDLRPGLMVHIQNIGKRFQGKYLITSTQHTYTPSEGYTSLFCVDGKAPGDIVSVLGGDSGNGDAKMGGNIVIGIVTDNKDPKGQGRVKVKYPWLTEGHASFWARQCSQMAGKGRGMFNIPEINNEVLIAFEHGDTRRPYILGQLWNGKDGMPGISGNAMHGAGSVVNRRGLYSRVGHMVDVDDTGGAGIKLTTAGGVKVHCTDDGPTILCSTPGGQSITITDAGSLIKLKDNAGDVMTMSQGTINLVDQAGDTTTLSGGTITLHGKQSINLIAPVVTITGFIAVQISAVAVSITGAALASIQSGVRTFIGSILKVVAGAPTVEIDGGEDVKITAPKIKLN